MFATGCAFFLHGCLAIFPAADMSGLFAMGATFMLGAPDNKFRFPLPKTLLH
jgi:hypothetical protein